MAGWIAKNLFQNIENILYVHTFIVFVYLSMQKIIHSVHNAEPVNMDGVSVLQPLPSRNLETADPFLLLHHWKHTFTGGAHQSEVGVGPHPHCGFSPVTFVFAGGVHHRDSLGNDSRVYAGGVQWMNSGRGIIHSERPVAEIAAHGGQFEIIQLWINTPAAFKNLAPEYIAVDAHQQPVVNSADKKSRIRIVSGKLLGQTGPVKPITDVKIAKLDFEAGGKISLDVGSGYNTLLYVLEGKLTIGSNVVSMRQLSLLSEAGADVEIETVEDGKALLLAGKPLIEPVVFHGPFVLSRRDQVIKAINDYQLGKMGHLTEQFTEQ
ncbi:MAG: pirin family protein [Salibacteraceae bacterium]